MEIRRRSKFVTRRVVLLLKVKKLRKIFTENGANNLFIHFLQKIIKPVFSRKNSKKQINPLKAKFIFADVSLNSLKYFDHLLVVG